MHLTQDMFLTQHVLQPTSANRVLDVVLLAPSGLVDNVEIYQPLVNSDHNQVHFNTWVITYGNVNIPEA